MSGWSERPAPPSVEAQLASAELTADQQARVAELADRIYGHVLRVVMLDRLYMVEQCVWSELHRLRIDDASGALASALLAEALHRVGHAPDRQVTMIPDGISPDEVIAAEYDDACVMCRSEAADMKYRLSGQRCRDLEREGADKEWLEIMRQAAREWRANNAEALRRFGLG